MNRLSRRANPWRRLRELLACCQLRLGLIGLEEIDELGRRFGHG